MEQYSPRLINSFIHSPGRFSTHSFPTLILLALPPDQGRLEVIDPKDVIMQAHDDPLIKEYFEKIRLLAVKALAGKSVQEQVENIVKDAAEHFSIVQTGTELDNLRRFMDFLAFAAETTPSSQPEMRATLAGC